MRRSGRLPGGAISAAEAYDPVANVQMN